MPHKRSNLGSISPRSHWGYGSQGIPVKDNAQRIQGAHQGRQAHDRYLSRPNGAAVTGAARALASLYAPVTDGMPDMLAALAGRLDEALAEAPEPAPPASKP